ncbi:hypothetical protein [Virgibacillus sp. DJP39]|uniref:hypothetical protein n=1 Tax=Virgibacillus sp. DJP39 TaxID=3409790 RepID=UPI003BB4DF43
MGVVREETYIEKDYIKSLYDPVNRLNKYLKTQHLSLSAAEYRDDVIDVAWVLFQYNKSAARGNDLWSVNMLHHVMIHLARVLFHRYNPNRAQLGLKTIEMSLEENLRVKIRDIYQNITPYDHSNAVKLIKEVVSDEADWILSNLEEGDHIKAFFKKMISPTNQHT